VTTAAELVIGTEHAFMASYVVDALATDAMLVGRMAERGARIFVVQVEDIEEDTEIDVQVQRALDAVDVGSIQLPIFIAQLHLYRLRGRYFGEGRRPLAVRVTSGTFLGVIAIGEGGALFMNRDLERESSPDAVARLRTLVG